MAKKKPATSKPTAQKGSNDTAENALHVSLDDCWVEQTKTGPCLVLRVVDKDKHVTAIYLNLDQDDLDGMEDMQGILWGELDALSTKGGKD